MDCRGCKMKREFTWLSIFVKKSCNLWNPLYFIQYYFLKKLKYNLFKNNSSIKMFWNIFFLVFLNPVKSHYLFYFKT